MDEDDARPDGPAAPREAAAPRGQARRVPPEWVSSRPRAERARRVADVLRQWISSGRFADDVLPDERVLAEQLDASRNAVREALSLLRDEGLLTRRRGVGTVVVTPTYGHGLDRLAGLAEALAGHGTVTNEVLVAEVVTDPPADVMERLCLEAGAAAVHIERVRRVDGVPVSLDSTYLTADIGRGVLRGDLETRDIFTVIEETIGGPLGRADIEVRAANADPETAALLGVRAGAAIFVIDRLTRLSDGTPVDAELLRIRSDRMALRATLYRGLR
ncbi:UTRA domain-containing protein [Nonomuraea phyllanthi]|uniref:UTRA domain-containing protein n=1 Tax=Nonomuraea phyllanthi TaxID=2219224 RepID=A0A5C4W6F9_9ACTN|nr:GntR family transcriptional regulator [Nonomuraea phyllanthi]KAB8191911.1 UTRA domain-containing protein [Nonomuraea phyllanthi]